MLLRRACVAGSVLVAALFIPWDAATASGASPGLETALGNYDRSRTSTFSVGVWDESTGRSFFWRASANYDNASIVKVNILETVLWRAQRAHRWLTSWEQQQAGPMITRSDNDAATRLWNHVGGSRGLAAYDRFLGLRSTTFDPGGHWGLTVSTVGDQLRLVRAIGAGPSPLSSQSRAYARAQMEHVEADQRWGISAGVPNLGTVALKNGWLPRATHGWRVNSIGRVVAGGRRYDIAVLSMDNPTMSYGVATVEGVSHLVWKALQPPPQPSSTPTPGPPSPTPTPPQPSATDGPAGSTPTPTDGGAPSVTATPADSGTPTSTLLESPPA